MGQNKNMEKIYDAVFVFESNFQKDIIDYLIKIKYAESTYLIIDASHNFIKLQDSTYKINLNGLINSIKSLPDLLRWNSIIYTSELICVGIAGINSRLFEAIIKYKKLTLIDDGIGTPILLNNPKLWYLKKKFIRCFLFDYLLLFLLKGKVLKTTSQIIHQVSSYYTVYDLPFQYDFEVAKLDFFKQYKFSILKGEVGFIGAPMENLSKLVSILKLIYNKYNKRLNYYPHPRENINHLREYTSLCNIIDTNGTVENFWKSNGIPETIISFSSSVLLNLKQINKGDLFIYYIHMSNDKFMEPYNKLLDSLEIMPLYINEESI